MLAEAQWNQYDYRRPLTNVKSNWHRLALPDDIYGSVNSRLNDIRIIKVYQGDTLEVPYLIKTPSAVSKKVEFEVLNKTRKGEVFYYTFDVGKEESVDFIELDFRQDNFDLRITLEGSQDQKEWFTIVDNYRILSIRNNLTDYQFTNIRFPKSKFQYLRMSIPSSVDPQFQRASISRQLESDRQVKLHQPVNTSIQNNRENKQTIVKGDLAMPLPISALKIKVDEDIDYYRTVNIEYLRDSFNTEKGWKYNYASIYKGTLSSLENNQFKLTTTVAQRFRAVIENYDNRPLNILGFEAEGEVNELIARFDEPQNGDYYLLYGNGKVRTPNYDIKNFKSSIPGNLTEVIPGEAQEISHEHVSTRPLFENQLWLWAEMIVIIGLLGWFSLKMMKSR